jgi:DNA helicase IV
MHEIVAQEEKILQSVLSNLSEQRRKVLDRIAAESIRARELTADLVSLRRAEDKQLVASDEAVSHGIVHKCRTELEVIDKLLKRPYFARFIVAEDTEDGKVRELEYRLSSFSNPENRIIDWRSSPLAKLYYNYAEGEEFNEIILGRERTGKVLKKIKVLLSENQLNQIVCGNVTYIRRRDGNVAESWEEKRGVIARDQSTGVTNSYQRLPELTAFLSEDQFRLISADVTETLFIQGVAGSGKTTVALYRLSYLIHNTESEKSVSPHHVAFITGSNLLKAYTINSLSNLGLEPVRVLTLAEWLPDLSILSPKNPSSPYELSSDNGSFMGGRTLSRIKGSRALALTYIEKIKNTLLAENSRQGEEDYTPEEIFDLHGKCLMAALASPASVINHDDTKLITPQDLKALGEVTLNSFENGILDLYDYSLLVLLENEIFGQPIFNEVKSVDLAEGSRAWLPTRRWHDTLVLDEAQDLSYVQLLAVAKAVKEVHHLILVGDINQAIYHREFPGWQTLIQDFNLGSENGQLVTLNISHRNTYEIMRFAESIMGRVYPFDDNLNLRRGRPPILFRCGSENSGITAAREWLLKAAERYPNGLTAVLANDEREAKLAYSYLKPTFGEQVRLETGSMYQGVNGLDFARLFDAGIVITTPKSVKGLEFTNVLLWNLRKSDPSSKISENNKEIDNFTETLYVAATRAEDNLSLIAWGKGLKDLSFRNASNIIRCVDVGLAE